jgi:hypothetical protein
MSNLASVIAVTDTALTQVLPSKYEYDNSEFDDPGSSYHCN